MTEMIKRKIVKFLRRIMDNFMDEYDWCDLLMEDLELDPFI